MGLLSSITATTTSLGTTLGGVGTAASSALAPVSSVVTPVVQTVTSGLTDALGLTPSTTTPTPPIPAPMTPAPATPAPTPTTPVPTTPPPEAEPASQQSVRSPSSSALSDALDQALAAAKARAQAMIDANRSSVAEKKTRANTSLISRFEATAAMLEFEMVMDRIGKQDDDGFSRYDLGTERSETDRGAWFAELGRNAFSEASSAYRANAA